MTYFFKDKIEDLVNEQEFYAIAKTAKGAASEGEQKLAMRTIALKICRINDQSFDPTNDRTSSFNEGVRYVGRMLLKIDQVESDYFQQLKAIKEKKVGMQEFLTNKLKNINKKILS